MSSSETDSKSVTRGGGGISEKSTGGGGGISEKSELVIGGSITEGLTNGGPAGIEGG